LCFFTLAARGDIEFDVLTLVEGLVALALDVGEVDEHVVAVFTRDEAVALLGVEELHGACSQFFLSSVSELILVTCSFDQSRRFPPDWLGVGWGAIRRRTAKPYPRVLTCSDR
jgi:hypothetical protein